VNDFHDDDKDEDGADHASNSSDGESSIRANCFQLPPVRVSDLLAEASATRSRSISPSSSGPRPVRKREERVLSRVKEEKGWKEDGADIGHDGLGKVLRGDVGYVMRKRAEEGYGLNDVGLSRVERQTLIYA